MAKKQQPLSIVSYDGEDPKLHFDDEQFLVLEKVYDQKLDADARSELLDECNKYMLSLKVERLRQTWTDVSDIIPRYREAAKALWNIAYEQERHSDAYYKFSWIFENVVESQLLKLNTEHDLYSFDPENSERGYIPVGKDEVLPERAYLLKITDGLIRELAMCLTVSLNLTEQVIREEAKISEDEILITAPTEYFFLSIRKWAKRHDLPIASATTREGYSAGPFSDFLAELISMLPEEYRGAKSPTAGGIEAKLKRIVTENNKRRLGQNQKSD